MINNVKFVELNMSFATALCCNKNYQEKFDEQLKERFCSIYKFSNHDRNNLFHYYKKVFILMSIWMIGKKLMKHHYLKNKIFTVT